MGLHPHGLEKIRGGIRKIMGINMTSTHSLVFDECIKNPGKICKTREKLLGRGQPIQPVSTIFNPLVKGLAIF